MMIMMLMDSALPGSWDGVWRQASRGAHAPLSRVLHALTRLSRVLPVLSACAAHPHLGVEIHTLDNAVACALKPGFSTEPEPTVSVSLTDRNGSVRFGASLSCRIGAPSFAAQAQAVVTCIVTTPPASLAADHSLSRRRRCL